MTTSEGGFYWPAVYLTRRTVLRLRPLLLRIRTAYIGDLVIE